MSPVLVPPRTRRVLLLRWDQGALGFCRRFHLRDRDEFRRMEHWVNLILWGKLDVEIDGAWLCNDFVGAVVLRR